MNKKLVSIVMSAATLVSGAVFADYDPQFYVGAELQTGHKKGLKKIPLKSEKKVIILQKTKGDTASPINTKAQGATLFLGSRLNENLGFELGGSRLATQKYKTVKRNGVVQKGVSFSIKNENVYADAMGYLPIDSATDLIGSVGVGRLSTTVSRKDVTTAVSRAQKYTAKSHKMGVRVGVGAQYKFNENVGARVMVRYQQGNKLVKNMTSAGLGMFYQF